MKSEYTFKVYPQGLGRSVYRVIKICSRESLDTLARSILNSYRFNSSQRYEYEHGKERFGKEKSRLLSIYEIDLNVPLTLIVGIDQEWKFVIRKQKEEWIDEYIEPKIIKARGDLFPFVFDQEQGAF